MTARLLDAWVSWYCPECKAEDRTRPLPHNAARMHDCPRLHGLSAPMVRQGVKAKLVSVERQDYIRDEVVTRDDRGRPIMAIQTVRDHGQDVRVFAPVARVRVTPEITPLPLRSRLALMARRFAQT